MSSKWTPQAFILKPLRITYERAVTAVASVAELLGVQWDHAATGGDSGTYRLHPHAARQATEKGFDHSAVLDAANDPAHSYPNGRYPGQMRHIKNGIVAVVDPAKQHVITVYEDRTETALRPDQKDADAQAYGRKRARTVGGRR
jgi:hypothetical protein